MVESMIYVLPQFSNIIALVQNNHPEAEISVVLPGHKGETFLEIRHIPEPGIAKIMEYVARENVECDHAQFEWIKGFHSIMVRKAPR
jgi:hypothetical protein